MKTLTIIKIGGNIIDQVDKLDDFLEQFSKVPGNKILIHGGGKIATATSEKLGVVPKMTGGRRITDKASLEVVTMVYAGLINKNIVAKLQCLDCPAIGLTGADANSILARRRPVKTIDFGFVGDLTSDSVNVPILTGLIQQGLVPVFAAITHDGKGQLLNTNADTLAASLASALSTQYEVTLMYCFEKKGVLQSAEDEEAVIPLLKPSDLPVLKKKGIISEGMIPKLENAFDALKNGASKVIIGHAGELFKLGKEAFGTQIIK